VLSLPPRCSGSSPARPRWFVTTVEDQRVNNKGGCATGPLWVDQTAVVSARRHSRLRGHRRRRLDVRPLGRKGLQRRSVENAHHNGSRWIDVFDEGSQEFTTQGDGLYRSWLPRSSVVRGRTEAVSRRRRKQVVQQRSIHPCHMVLTSQTSLGSSGKVAKLSATLEINVCHRRGRRPRGFNDAPGAPPARDVITAELIYYWMTVFHPFSCETGSDRLLP